MKTCEVCGGMGCRPTDCLICSACQGTGVICLGWESRERHAELVVKAREKAARLGWMEEVWLPVDPVANYPALARKVYRVISSATSKRRAS